MASKKLKEIATELWKKLEGSDTFSYISDRLHHRGDKQTSGLGLFNLILLQVLSYQELHAPDKELDFVLTLQLREDAGFT